MFFQCCHIIKYSCWSEFFYCSKQVWYISLLFIYLCKSSCRIYKKGRFWSYLLPFRTCIWSEVDFLLILFFLGLVLHVYDVARNYFPIILAQPNTRKWKVPKSKKSRFFLTAVFVLAPNPKWNWTQSTKTQDDFERFCDFFFCLFFIFLRSTLKKLVSFLYISV